MSPRIRLSKASLLCLAFAAAAVVAMGKRADAGQPNVVFMLADDLGWRDVSCYGSPFCETPNMDRLASRGMRFTNAYSAGSICSPTRCSLMTGRYPARVGITDYIPGLASTADQWQTPQTMMQLPLEEVTMGEMFRAAGFETFYAGKWHLGNAGYEPSDQGFEHFVSDAELGKYSNDWKVGTRITAAFDKFITQQRDSSKPFLAYLAFHEPHTPILEYPNHIERFQRKSAQLGAEPEPRTERDGLTRARQDYDAYGSEVAGLDDLVGHVLDTLDKSQLTSETIIVFFSDNGGLSTKAQPGPTNNDPLRAGKGWLYEGGIRVPLIVSVPGRVAENSVTDQVTISCDLLPTLLDLAGVEKQPEKHIDGRSIAPVLLGEREALEERPLYWHYPHYHGSTWAPGAAMREGKWKLVQLDYYNSVELYDLSSDLSESRNLAEQYPERVADMQQRLAHWQAAVGAKQPIPNNLQRDQLVAWCIVPFDASQRSPQARADMLNALGLTKLAYDWREEHVASWDEELDTLQSHDIELTAFWCSSSLHPVSAPGNQRILDFLKRRKVATQLWISLPSRELESIPNEQERVAQAAAAIRELAKEVEPLGCQVGLYNHGGWIGRPSVMVEVMEQLNDMQNVGLVYNFHHAHEDLDEFPDALQAMKPYLLCLNLNGTTAAGPKIQPIGDGERDRDILSWIRQSQYRGLIGVLDHRPELDAKESLLQNLQGLESLIALEPHGQTRDRVKRRR